MKANQTCLALKLATWTVVARKLNSGSKHGPIDGSPNLQTTAGFTRTELLATVFILALLAALSLPMLANTKARSDRITCVNNLRLIGRAFALWAHERGDLMPWQLSISKGGTGGDFFSQNVWLHLAALSNELTTPRVLACPSDAFVRVATDFSASFTNGGFLAPGYRNSSVSYFLGLHAVYSGPFPEAFVSTRDTALAGDYNLRFTSVEPCPVAGIANSIRISYESVAWLQGPHGWSGNILLTGGQVEQTPNARIADAFGLPEVPIHVLKRP